MMEDAGEGDRGGWWRSRTTGLVIAVFVMPLALLAVTGGLPAVALIYAALFVEGDIIAYLILRRRRPTAGRRNPDGETPVARRAFLNADRVEALVSIVRWAEDGSDFSRKEVAQAVARIMGHSRSVSLGQRGPWASGGLSESVVRVVHPYGDDPVVKSELDRMGSGVRLVGDSKKEWARVGRSQYLASLEEVVSELEREMNQPGGV